MPDLANPAPPIPGVHRIAVLRGGALGDLLFALPALESLRLAYPGAEIVLLGMPLARALLLGRPGSPVDRVEELPYAPGVREGGAEDPAATAAFVERMRAERFDLALQAHGGGRNSNPFLTRLGARVTAGTATEDAPRLDRTLTYRYYQHEVVRWLEVAALAGGRPVAPRPRLTATEEERRAARGARPDGHAGHVVLHPGATDPRRRWAVDRFARVAADLAGSGYAVSVVGDATEARLAASVVEAARALLDPDAVARVVDTAGRLSLSQLVGVLADADLVIANDSGPRHLADALGTPTVGLFWVGNALNAAPLGRADQRILLGWTTHCPVCGVDFTQVGWTAERCPHDPSIVADVTVEAVLEEARALLGTR